MEPPVTLPLTVRSVDALLDQAHSPLTGPHIHPEAARALRMAAASHSRRTSFHLRILVPAADLTRGAEVAEAIRAHFLDEVTDATQRLHELRRKGQWSFLVALVFAGLFILLSEFISGLGDRRFFSILAESLVIVAWVILWGPADTLLCARFPVWRERKLARHLAEASVELAPKP